MRELGIGRTPLREAVKRLSLENLVAVHPRRSTVVTAVEAADIVHITEVRAELEGYAAELAALRMDGETRTLAEALREEIEAPRPAAFWADYERRVAVARGQLDEEAFAEAWDQGRAMTPEQALAEEETAPKQATYPAGLTAREAEVLSLITMGLSNQEIAERTLLSLNSIKSYIRSAYRKIGVQRRTQAVIWATQNGFVPARARVVLGDP